MSSKDTYIVIGGSGMVGRHIVEALLARGDVVFCFDVVQRHYDVPFYMGDISEEGSFLDALRKSGATCIFHTASPRQGAKPDGIYQKVNVDGTKAVIAAAITCGVKKLVWTSSSGIVFDGHHLANVDETQPIPKKPVDPYNGSKAEAECIVLNANGQNGLLTVALRPSTVFGPGDTQFMRAFQETFDSGWSHIQIGDNTNLTDWTYVDNVADAHLLAADKLAPENPDVAGQAFFITNGEPIPFWDFSRKVYERLREVDPASAACSQRPICSVPKTFGYLIGLLSEWWNWFRGTEPIMTRYRVMYFSAVRYHNIGKARAVLGYDPKVSVDEGINRMVDWWIAFGRPRLTLSVLPGVTRALASTWTADDGVQA
ncbi:hypothetical protein PUNSTDRAFT_143387 [Punctularia strigosozonata HHB-11173 SS5]|uniref:uncharacterized protein n=1 Tax=Punctularia strigosozonata (strain HHB-11173) TaxID=741275 RepID=UPI0004418315|nr:uncharacterized protein PUNSTDRAFT_143387 [Punctularia strigosozonata HHB-11173 SS5]EIN10049.1 hypothetical protein PUNSTDRAFT_143387 [Punctularia strigosozonata HHB-11173 SS5]